jgi:hypothetical protein
VSGKHKVTTRLSFERHIDSYVSQVADRTNENTSVQPFVLPPSSSSSSTLPPASPSHAASGSGSDHPHSSSSSTKQFFRSFSRSISTASTSASGPPSTPSTLPRSEIEKSYHAAIPPLSMLSATPSRGSYSNSETSSLDRSDVTGGGGGGGDLLTQEEVTLPDDSHHSDFVTLPERPWNWEADALELERLDIEKNISDREMEEIEARALAPMDCNAVYLTLSRIHSNRSSTTGAGGWVGSGSGSKSRISHSQSLSQGHSERTSGHGSHIFRSSSSNLSNGGGEGRALALERKRSSLDSYGETAEEEDDEIDRPDEEMSRFFASSSMT